MNRESQTIRDNSHDLQPLRYIFTICIEKLLKRIESYDSNRTIRIVIHTILTSLIRNNSSSSILTQILLLPLYLP
jgi:hypothetical protein